MLRSRLFSRLLTKPHPNAPSPPRPKRDTFPPQQHAPERQEHDSFLHYVKHRVGTQINSCTPKHLCSSIRIDRERNTNVNAVQQLQGRGLVATKDIHAGAIIATAPLAACAIWTDVLLAQGLDKPPTTDEENADLAKQGLAPRPDFAASFAAIPKPEVCVQIAHDAAGIRDTFISTQAHFAMCLALERCDEHSVYKPFFETLPHPAVIDHQVVTIFKDFLGEDKLDAYGGHCKDHNDMLAALRARWEREAGSGCGGGAGKILVPPMPLLQWAWRIVLSRQALLPVYGKPGLTKAERQQFGVGTHFFNWCMVHAGEPEATCIPCLIPFFDLADHGPVSNCRIDIVTRPIEVDKMPPLYRLSQSYAKAPPSETLFKRFSRFVAGGGPFSSVVGPKRDTAAFIELQALSEIKQGSDLNVRFVVDVDDHAWTLYRFGFMPVTYADWAN